MANKEKKKKEYCSGYHDFSTFKPEVVKILENGEAKLVEEHIEIIKALRNKQLTVKEMHQLYYDEDKKKFSVTIKTIYRYLEKLEKAGLVAVTGYRVTEGTRVCEKLYSRTASVFFPKLTEKEEKEGKGKEFVEKVNFLMSVAMKTPEPAFDSFNDFFQQLIKLEYQTVAKLFEEAKVCSDVADIYSKTDIEEINHLHNYISLFVVLLNNPELYDKLKELFKK